MINLKTFILAGNMADVYPSSQLIDELIVGCLTFSCKYFMYANINDDNKLTITISVCCNRSVREDGRDNWTATGK